MLEGGSSPGPEEPLWGCGDDTNLEILTTHTLAMWGGLAAAGLLPHPPPPCRLQGVPVLLDHHGQRGGDDGAGGGDHVHLPAVRLLHLQGTASPGLGRRGFFSKLFTPWQLHRAEVFSFGLKRPDFWSQPRKRIELLRRVSLPAVQRLGGGVWGGLLGSGQHGNNGVIQGVMERGPWAAGRPEPGGSRNRGTV